MSLDPPRPRLPPLNALRAFEAAARLGSFKLAGEELYVTSGAIAQHVKSLESWTAGELFRRHPQGVELTELGRSVLPAFTAAFDRLGAAAHQLSVSAAPQEIRIAALPSIAQLWLSPRLPAIRHTLPEVQISVTALEQPPNLKRDLFDISLFFASREAQDDRAGTIICEDELLPVCAPEIAQHLALPEHLRDCTLLRDSQWRDDWPRWLSIAAPDLTLNEGGPVHSLYSLAVEDARSGGGVLIGHSALVQAFLDDGSLIAPFPERLHSGQVLRLRSRGGAQPRGEVQELAELLVQGTC
ncbi:MAG: LysR substrate-binding domain-containing protein [Pseudomonadota bacterium]